MQQDTVQRHRSSAAVAVGRDRTSSARIILALAIAALLSTMSVMGPVEAKPGNGNGKDKASATLEASPNPAQAGGETFELSGCGYDTSATVDFVLETGYNMWFWSVEVDSDGCINDTKETGKAGTYEIEAYQRLNGKKDTLMAETELTVVE